MNMVSHTKPTSCLGLCTSLCCAWVIVLPILLSTAHAAPTCDAGACSESDGARPEVASALLQLGRDVHRQPAAEASSNQEVDKSTDKSESTNDSKSKDSNNDPAGVDTKEVNANTGVTQTVIDETLAHQQSVAKHLVEAEKVKEEKARIEKLVEEKKDAAQKALDELENYTAVADKKAAKVEWDKQEDEKFAAQKLKKYGLALKNATEERIHAERVATEKRTAENDALQQFAVVQAIMQTKAFNADEKDADAAAAKVQEEKEEAGENVEEEEGAADNVEEEDEAAENVQEEEEAAENVEGGKGAAENVEGEKAAAENVEVKEEAAANVEGAKEAAENVEGKEEAAANVQGANEAAENVEEKEEAAKSVDGEEETPENVEAEAVINNSQNNDGNNNNNNNNKNSNNNEEGQVVSAQLAVKKGSAANATKGKTSDTKLQSVPAPTGTTKKSPKAKESKAANGSWFR